MFVKLNRMLRQCFIIALLLVGCSSIPYKPTHTPTPIMNNPPVETLISPTDNPQEPISTSTNDVFGSPDISKIQPGIYLLYMPSTGLTINSVEVYAIRPGDQNGSHLLTVRGYFDSSPNGKFLAYTNPQSNTLDILDLESGYVDRALLPNNNCIDISVSANGKMLSCGGTEIFFSSVGNNEWQLLTYWSQKKPEDTWDTPRFSPDDKWLAYFNLGDFSHSKDDGLYLTNTNCSNSINTCKANTVGPIFSEIAGSPGNGSFFSWSPDSRTIALPGYNKISLLDIQTKNISELKIDGYPSAASWSPAGDLIAYSDYGVYVIEPDGENNRIVKGGAWLLGWLNISWKFKNGESYVITSAGSNLNLRELPAIKSQVVKKLQAGDLVTILDGPTKFDGYTWWKVKTQENNEGWVADIPDWYKPVK